MTSILGQLRRNVLTHFARFDVVRKKLILYCPAVQSSLEALSYFSDNSAATNAVINRIFSILPAISVTRKK